MPNIQTKELKLKKLPLSLNGYEFKFLATNSKGVSLVYTSFKDRDFFLKISPKKDKILIKYDSLTRLSPVYIIQDALKAFVSLHDIKLCNENIYRKKEFKHIQTPSKYLKSVNFFLKDFTYCDEISIEIGFGSGRHLLYLAKMNPNQQFIGVEIHKPSIEQVIKNCKLQNIDNLLVVDFDARIFLQLLESNTISNIYIHFPIPWDKKPHRRVISDGFLNEAMRVLKQNGKLELRTDSDNYFDYSFKTFMKTSSVDLKIRKNHNLSISSKYEDRWKKQNKNIYDLILTNHTLHDNKNEFTKLEFDRYISFDKIVKKFKNHTIRGKDFFVHFEDIFIIDKDSGILRASFGAYEKPESKYILFKDNKIQYFPDTIIPIDQNLKAHKTIKEFIYE